MLLMSRLLIDEQSRMMARKMGRFAAESDAGGGRDSDQRRSCTNHKYVRSEGLRGTDFERNIILRIRSSGMSNDVRRQTLHVLDFVDIVVGLVEPVDEDTRIRLCGLNSSRLTSGT